MNVARPQPLGGEHHRDKRAEPAKTERLHGFDSAPSAVLGAQLHSRGLRSHYTGQR